ncbi:uncharacterized protein EHS24_007787 [Apiotrichum porosum]|uniref:SURP motif domain-containing protein n=1 Tax=Apiotrichum porosum TaxID=105984 RepID=A0A427XVD2_9TREE|nr:uncharacterized protein EHS24_007787 [Apiotrichum porosum]RSH82792.1 hypothetical protein EHS24_007787 [Apiotrichum porosum]
MPRPAHPKRPRQQRRDDTEVSTSSSAALPPAAFTRAYETQLVRSRPPKPALMRWTGGEQGGGQRAQRDVWADRHDIVHLLSSLDVDTSRDDRPRPPSPASSSGSRSSYASWSLPSDEEEAWALSGDDEVAAYKAGKRRAWVEGLREARLRDRAREDGATKQAAMDAQDRLANEPPTAEILNLMEHTARALAASPNAAALEMRILARHSADARFTFLRAGAVHSAVWARVRAAAVSHLPSLSHSGGAGSASTAASGPSGTVSSGGAGSLSLSALAGRQRDKVKVPDGMGRLQGTVTGPHIAAAGPGPGTKVYNQDSHLSSSSLATSSQSTVEHKVAPNVRAKAKGSIGSGSGGGGGAMGSLGGLGGYGSDGSDSDSSASSSCSSSHRSGKPKPSTTTSTCAPPSPHQPPEPTGTPPPSPPPPPPPS